MNGKQQTQRFTAVRTLEAQLALLDETATAAYEAEVIARQKAVNHVYAECLAAVGDERTHRLTLADEQRAYVDREDRKNELSLSNFKHMTFWQRTRWIFTGRTA